MPVLAIATSALVAAASPADPAALLPMPAIPRLPDDEAGLRYTPARTDCSDEPCSRLTCKEACHKLLVCGQRKRDRDGDGIPCENVCTRPCR